MKNKLAEIIAGIVFEKFNKLLPIQRTQENKFAIAFYHPKPSYKLHILIVPKKAIKNISEIKENDLIYIQKVFELAQRIILDLNLEETNYRIITNGGDNQKVKQLHFHLISDGV